ncbi:MAG TPA: hypothetical protein PL110_01210 [Candidatus Eremiobacteraeota bacterium]|nr:MAG: hypothetical protein BWY64_03309 [bacterium ADurb.Bin363]HPZ06705.1 hypothetical protein [Candidatus Eremiobacteraeota bacterium]
MVRYSVTVLLFILLLCNSLNAREWLIEPGTGLGWITINLHTKEYMLKNIGTPDDIKVNGGDVYYVYASYGFILIFNGSDERLSRIVVTGSRYKTSKGFHVGSAIGTAMIFYPEGNLFKSLRMYVCNRTGVTFCYNDSSKKITSIIIHSQIYGERDIDQKGE